MSLTSYRAAPPRDSRSECLPMGRARRVEEGEGGGAWRAWQRPTLPHLEVQYHRRRGFSRPSSGWDRVFGPWLLPPGRPSAPHPADDGPEICALGYVPWGVSGGDVRGEVSSGEAAASAQDLTTGSWR